LLVIIPGRELAQLRELIVGLRDQLAVKVEVAGIMGKNVAELTRLGIGKRVAEHAQGHLGGTDLATEYTAGEHLADSMPLQPADDHGAQKWNYQADNYELSCRQIAKKSIHTERLFSLGFLGTYMTCVICAKEYASLG